VDKYSNGPESGRKLLRGFSAYIRASNACPTIGIDDCTSGKGFPTAT
jgi:hypothetical protein